MATQILNIPLNRVEGDLEISVAMDGNKVTNAWSSGLMYRGIENILRGRSAMDGLVITPRVCGICTTSHLTAAVLALDAACGAVVPDDAIRMRNLTLLAEQVQSDVRHAFLMFNVDLANPAHADKPFYQEARRRYQPFQGETVIETVRQSAKLVEIIAIVGGQWPHSSFMVPGGLASAPSTGDLLQCTMLIKQFRKWYEQRVLGCSLERWQEIKSLQDLDDWLAEHENHRRGEVGFFLASARAAGLDKLGGGHDHFLSYGAFDLPKKTSVAPLLADATRLVPAGFLRDGQRHDFDQEQIREEIKYSWYEGNDGGLHPADGETRPYATGAEGEKYSWAKAPRYLGVPAETGPLAERLIAGDPLITDLKKELGATVLTRQFARLTRPATMLPIMSQWIAETDPNGLYYQAPPPLENCEGFGLTQVPRGALGHWLQIRDGKIARYQIITPTAWNGSPRGDSDLRGPWEEALIGATVKDLENPVELGHIVRSFDACLVCTVHSVQCGNKRRQPGVRIKV